MRLSSHWEQLRGFGPGINFQQTEAVSVSAGQQAAGARCQDVCSYFPKTKIRVQTFSAATQRYSRVQEERERFSSYSAAQTA